MQQYTTLIFLLSLIGSVFNVTFAQSADWQSKIDPAVWESLDKKEKVDFFVLMKEQANTETPNSYTKQEKAAYVFGQLEATAERSQTNVLNILKTGNHPHQAFWVANAVKAKGKFELIEELAKLSEVARILPNQAIQHHAPVRDPALDIYNGGGMSKSGEGDIEWGILQIRANLLWEQGVRGSGVVIGGQDTGYDWEHTALVKKYRGSQSSDTSHHYNWHDAIHEQHELNSDANNPCGFDVNYPCDDGSHGTHTMGTMVGLYDQTGTGTGKISHIGVAPDAQWIGCRNMERGWGTPETYMECFQWFLAPTDLDNQNPDPNQAPHVINNSWSCPVLEGCTTSNFEVMRIAVENLRNSGVVVVVSAGNSGPSCNRIDRPAAIYGESFSIGASTTEDTVIYFSSRGNVEIDGSLRIKPNVVAPGVGINSSKPNNTFGFSSGTSMAGPHVAGLVALLISADPSLAGQVDRIEELIEQSAVPIYVEEDCGDRSGSLIPNNTAGYGRVDAWNALRLIRPELTNAQPLDQEKLRIFPNPFQTHIMVATPTDMDLALVRIHNALGQLVVYKYFTFQRVQQFDLSGLPNGLYFISIENDEECYTGRIIKNE